MGYVAEADFRPGKDEGGLPASALNLYVRFPQIAMWSRQLTVALALASALLLAPAQAVAGAKERVAALAPSGVVLVVDEKGN